MNYTDCFISTLWWMEDGNAGGSAAPPSIAHQARALDGPNFDTSPPSSPRQPILSRELLDNLVDAIRDPLIVCKARVRGSSVVAGAGTTVTANESACALLNRTLASLQSLPLSALVTTASGRPPPHGLVSKCKLHCEGVEPVSVECDCRVFSGGSTVAPLLFCHLALADARDEDLTDALDAAEAVDLPMGDSAATVSAVMERSNESGMSASETIASSMRAKALADVQLEKMRILVVEDDAFSRAAILELCRACTFEVNAVVSGEACLEALEENMKLAPDARYNVVLCDVMMQGLSGHGTLVEIRKRYGDAMAVIMISSNEQHEIVEGCIRAGADSYLFKCAFAACSPRAHCALCRAPCDEHMHPCHGTAPPPSLYSPRSDHPPSPFSSEHATALRPVRIQADPDVGLLQHLAVCHPAALPEDASGATRDEVHARAPARFDATDAGREAEGDGERGGGSRALPARASGGDCRAPEGGPEANTRPAT